MQYKKSLFILAANLSCVSIAIAMGPPAIHGVPFRPYAQLEPPYQRIAHQLQRAPDRLDRNLARLEGAIAAENQQVRIFPIDLELPRTLPQPDPREDPILIRALRTIVQRVGVDPNGLNFAGLLNTLRFAGAPTAPVPDVIRQIINGPGNHHNFFRVRLEAAELEMRNDAAVLLTRVHENRGRTLRERHLRPNPVIGITLELEDQIAAMINVITGAYRYRLNTQEQEQLRAGLNNAPPITTLREYLNTIREQILNIENSSPASSETGVSDDKPE